MKFDFDTMEVTVIEHMRGGEKEVHAHMYEDPLNKILHGRLQPGASIGMHTHDTSSEIIYFISGTGKMLYDDTEEKVAAGNCHYCPKGHAHSMINDGTEDLTFFAVIPQQ